MKKTTNINLGGSPFIVDEDAYAILKGYLDDIADRLTADRDEVMEDVEGRMAEIFTANLSLRAQVVNATTVNRAIAVIGRPEEFGDHYHKARDYTRGEEPRSEDRPHKLYRSIDDRIVGGVCSGLARYMDIDITLVRVICVLLFFPGGLSLWVYIIMWIVIPRAPQVGGYGRYDNRRE
ncbi:MAG: PspC domain-containing protein [Rikenellaceae bacterium]|jgi:phage shock protein PspC (stress-responsive transcriptional regulator)|nr:PspC domain-containing protein [Rikenellaceae bacterium]